MILRLVAGACIKERIAFQTKPNPLDYSIISRRLSNSLSDFLNRKSVVDESIVPPPKTESDLDENVQSCGGCRTDGIGLAHTLTHICPIKQLHHLVGSID